MLKISQTIRGLGSLLVVPIGTKNTNSVEDIEILIPFKFCWIQFSGFREVENVSAISEARTTILFVRLAWVVDILLLVRFHWILVSSFRGEIENLTANQRPEWPSYLSEQPKNTNLVEDVEILLPVECRWIVSRGLREVDNLSSNQWPGMPSSSSCHPEKHKLGRGQWDLASCQVL